jgi:hypothetical protein
VYLCSLMLATVLVDLVQLDAALSVALETTQECDNHDNPG